MVHRRGGGRAGEGGGGCLIILVSVTAEGKKKKNKKKKKETNRERERRTWTELNCEIHQILSGKTSFEEIRQPSRRGPLGSRTVQHAPHSPDALFGKLLEKIM
ncbi:unnamed protein product [Prorocentrum cordatum]|uniref:Uncharacterized protein n=1 Tax=Prorocentrum cordatum TaxID=2364126 RepID=A0ABN9WL91_9DINO|nr:unnamed protein product [Polarella glacialis]